MLDIKRSSGSQEVTFVLYDQTAVVKLVTKTTTCADVISTLPRQPERLSVFESVVGIEKELPGKTRILKVWRIQGAKSGVQFVIRKSGKLGVNRHMKSRLKAKLEAFSRCLSIPSHKKKSINHAVPPTSTDVVVDRPLGNRDVRNVSALPSGGGVTCGQLPMTSTPRRATIAATTRSRINRQAVGDSLTTMKLAFRKTATSNVTVCSGRGGRVDDEKNIRRRTIVECDYDEYPLHITPVVVVTGRGKRCAVLQLTSTPKSAQPSRSYNTPSRPRVSVFPGQDGGCTGNQTCDSDSSFDSDTSCASSKLDVAFWDPLIPGIQPGLAENQWSGTGGTGFDYSFDCTFPAMTNSYQAGLCGYVSDGERSGAESDDGLCWQLYV